MIDIATCFTYAYSAGTFADFTQAITSDNASTNIINLDAAGVVIGGVKPPWLILRVVVAENGTLATSLEVALETDSDSGFATTRRQINIWNIPAARTQTAGNILINQPFPHFQYQQYVRLYFNVVTTAAALTVCGWMGSGPESACSDFDLAGL